MINMELWMTHYNELEAFIQKEGRKPMHDKNSSPEERSISYWVKDQKKYYKNGTLDAAWYHKIETLLDGVKNRNDLSWDKTYEELNEFLKANNGKEPKRGLGKKQEQLSYWLKDQRKALKNNNLSEERITKLDELEVLYGYEWRLIRKDKEERIFNELKKYIIENGKAPTEGYLKDYLDRQFYLFKKIEKPETNKKIRQKLTSRKDQLENLGVVFLSGEEKKTKRWFESYILLEEYVKTHDGEFPTNGELGIFLSRQRGNIDNLTEEQFTLLDQLGDWAKPLSEKQDEQWLFHYNELVEYMEAHDGWYPPASTPEGMWYYYQRKYAKEGKLLQNRRELLDQLGDWEKGNVAKNGYSSKIRKDNWDKMYNLLKQYVSEYGERPSTADPVFGKWLSNQKVAYKNGSLSEDRIRKLEPLIGDYLKEDQTRQRVKTVKRMTLNNEDTISRIKEKSR